MNNLISIGMQNNLTYKFPSHFHNSWEITYYKEGIGYNITNRKRYDFSAGTIICQPPLLPHEDDSKNGYKNIYFCVESFPFPTTEPIVFNDTPARDVLSILQHLYRHYHSMEHDNNKITNALLNVLYEYFLVLLNNKEDNLYVDTFERELINNLSNPSFSILEAMNQIPLCPDYFRRLFKQKTGTSPQDYLQSLRISYSKQLLKDSTLPLKHICAMCGYNDEYYFSRIFKKLNHVSPNLWRRQHIFINAMHSSESDPR